jgi:hypothetical protein
MDVEILSTWWWIDTTVDFLFFCDVVIILNTAIFENDQVIENRGEIFRRYLRGALVIDILAVFPFSLLI